MGEWEQKRREKRKRKVKRRLIFLFSCIFFFFSFQMLRTFPMFYSVPVLFYLFSLSFSCSSFRSSSPHSFSLSWLTPSLSLLLLFPPLLASSPKCPPPLPCPLPSHLDTYPQSFPPLIYPPLHPLPPLSSLSLFSLPFSVLPTSLTPLLPSCCPYLSPPCCVDSPWFFSVPKYRTIGANSFVLAACCPTPQVSHAGSCTVFRPGAV